MTMHEIRQEFKKKLILRDFVENKDKSKMLEIVGACFIADNDAIFSKVNEKYAKAEIAWYESQSRNVNDLLDYFDKIPAVWQMVASKDGRIQSNYGWAVFSKENGHQYEMALQKLLEDPNTRQAILIYNRPSMHTEWNEDGMHDFMCCQNNQFFIRYNKLDMIVNFRSNDARFGFLNDYYWMKYLQTQMHKDLVRDYPDLEMGKIYWNAGSLHMYERDFFLVDHYKETSKNGWQAEGEIDITKAEYREKYPNSEWI